MQKIRYEIDPYNRLVIDESGRKSRLSKYRKVVDGRFSLDKNNTLSYLIKAPISEGENMPNQLKLKGEWSLTKDHNLRLTLDKQARETFGDSITLQGEILDVAKNSLLFAVTTLKKDGTRSTYVLNLEGLWQADENNRLSFRLRKESGKYDILTFNGVWAVNKNHQIVYEYEKADLMTKNRRSHALIFRGYWDIRKKTRISYVLSGGTDSAFSFEVKAGIFKENYIKYEIGIKLSDKAKEALRTVKLSGRWNFKKGTGLTFSIEYGDRKVRAINLAAAADISKLTKGDGEVFLKALASRKESAVYAGATRRW